MYVINRIPTAHNFRLPLYEKLYGTLPDYSSLRVFGCTYFVLRPHTERNKFSPKLDRCVFLGYGNTKKVYQCYDSMIHKLYVSRHVTCCNIFHSIEFPCSPTIWHNKNFELLILLVVKMMTFILMIPQLKTTLKL